MRGKFITLEGQDGAGKSTNLSVIEQTLLKAGKPVLVTREPGGTQLGEKIRELVLNSDDSQFGDTAELLLIFAARAEHIESVIEPALKKGSWVLCDRFTDATYAYQGGGRGIDQSRIKTLENFVQNGLHPDLTFLLDVPVEVGNQRAGQRSDPDRFEMQENEFKNGVRNCYLNRSKAEPNRFKIIDASEELDIVKQSIEIALKAYLKTT